MLTDNAASSEHKSATLTVQPADQQWSHPAHADPTAGYQHLAELVSDLRKAFDEDGAGGAAVGAGSKRSAAAVDTQSAERRAPDMEPGPVPAGYVGGDDPLRMGEAP